MDFMQIVKNSLFVQFPDGKIGGVCNAKTASGCSDKKAECRNWLCQCIVGFTEVDGVCKEGKDS